MKIRHDILTDPAFQPGFDLLADATAVETDALLLADMATIARQRLWRPSGRRAILIGSTRHEAFADAFAALREPETVFFGRYLGDALR